MNTIILHTVLKIELNIVHLKICHHICVKILCQKCQKCGCANSNHNVNLSMEAQGQKS